MFGLKAYAITPAGRIHGMEPTLTLNGYYSYGYIPIVLQQAPPPLAWVESHLRLVVLKQSLPSQSDGNEGKRQPRCPILAEKQPQETDVRYPELDPLAIPAYQVIVSDSGWPGLDLL